MANLIPRSSSNGFKTSGQSRQNFTVGASERWVKPNSNQFKQGSSSVCERKDMDPKNRDSHRQEKQTTPHELLRLALEHGYRRPKYVDGRLARRIIQIDEVDSDSSLGEVEFLVHFSDGTVLGMCSLASNGIVKRAYHEQSKHNDFKIVHVVVDVCMDEFHCIDSILGQLTFRSKALFNVTIHKHKKTQQKGKPPAKYRRMKRYQSNNSYR